MILYSFTTSVFPAHAPGYGDITYFIMAVAGTGLFFASLLAHELAHALVARSRGIEVAGITLFVFGGLAHMRRAPATAGEEFWIAIVGPIMSFAVAGLLWLLSMGGVSLGISSTLTAVPYYIALLNLALAVFNLLPGFPLDGGRVLRAILWRLTGRAELSMRIASGTGQLLGWSLVALGLWNAIGGNVMSGLWLAFVGFFLRNAARSARSTVPPVPPVSGTNSQLSISE